MLKILQLTKHYPPIHGGIESVTFDLTEGLNERGYRCDVLSANDSNRLSVENFGPYTVTRAPRLKKAFSTSISPQLPFLLRKQISHYDIVHIHSPDPMAAGALFLQTVDKPIIVHWHCDIVNQKNLYRLYRPLLERILGNAARIITTNENTPLHSRQLKKFLSKVSVVPIGIIDAPIVRQDRVDALKARYGHKKIVFSLGRLVPYKGFEYLIEAAGFLNDDTVVLIGGKGPMADDLSRLIHTNNLTHKIHMLGNVPTDELNDYFSACDVFCLASLTAAEAFGVVLLEAMRYGKPLVTTNVPGSGMSWVNQHGLTGYSVEPRDPAALAQAIKDVLADKQRYAAFAHNAAQRFRDYFTRNRMVESMIGIYEEIARP